MQPSVALVAILQPSHAVADASVVWSSRLAGRLISGQHVAFADTRNLGPPALTGRKALVASAVTRGAAVHWFEGDEAVRSVLERVWEGVVFFGIVLPSFLFGLALLAYDLLPSFGKGIVLTFAHVDEQQIRPYRFVLGWLLMLVGNALLSAMFAGVEITQLTKTVARFVDLFGRMSAILDRMSDILAVEDAEETRAAASGMRRARRELGDIRAALAGQIRDAEARLRGEWRFVALFIVGSVIALATIFVTVIAWLVHPT